MNKKIVRQCVIVQTDLMLHIQFLFEFNEIFIEIKFSFH